MPIVMRNIRLILAFDGTDFHGWQRQPNLPTIQASLEEVLGRLTGATVEVCGSGRTDAGVHAIHQVANFHTTSRIPCSNLVNALNDLLPPSIRVKHAEEVPAAFHARYDAVGKSYRYRIVTAPICSPFLSRYVHHHPYPLDHTAMAQAARLFEGEHDFTSFAAADAEEEGKSRVRTIFSSCVLWRPASSMLVYDVSGNGFLRYMVRNIVGTLIEVGRGKLVPGDISRILDQRDRSQAGPTAAACGLCLMNVKYGSDCLLHPATA